MWKTENESGGIEHLYGMPPLKTCMLILLKRQGYIWCFIEVPGFRTVIYGEPSMPGDGYPPGYCI